ncbi:unnamed protein product [Cladocopium goreaui]|uniref:30S ribosomal protein S1 n=1 Tax=Cladocopium goreaui TaxID=2562237 RepID=A0A9P1DH73_9DINO|nr:unnamed protein product [Cladocopium goreaui]
MVKSGVKFRWRKTATVTLTSTPSQHSAAPGDWPKLNGANLDSLPEKVSWARLWADGVTPRKGVVLAMQDYGAVIAISQAQKGLVPASATSASELAQLARGAPVMVYITSKSFDTQKFNLALTPSAEPSQRLFRMKCDGRHPYSGVVSSIADFGYFVDVGFERPGFLPLRELPEGTEFNIGDQLTVYATSQHWRSGRFNLSLRQLEKPKKPKQHLIVDGLTPYQGIIQAVVDRVAVIDFGFDARGMLLVDDDVEVGTELTVYAVRRMRRNRRVFLSRTPSIRRVLMLKDVVADGQTPYSAKIAGPPRPGFGVNLDIGCEELALLPDHEIAVAPPLEDGMPVYIQHKTAFNGLLLASTTRRAVPRERLTALQADGWTPYEGVVMRRNESGTLVDIGCEVPGLLLPKEELPQVAMTRQGPVAALLRPVPDPEERLRAGAKVTVYVWSKSCFTGRVHVALEPRPQQGMPLHLLPVDGVTPLVGMVASISEVGAYVDLGCELLGRLGRRERGNERTRELSKGDVVEVFARRRNLEGGRISLGMLPDPQRRLSIDDVGRGEHEGIVVSVQHGVAFIDFYCEVSGMCSELLNSKRLKEGDRVLLRVEHLDDAGRFLVVPLKILHDHPQVEAEIEARHFGMCSRPPKPLRENEILYKDLVQNFLRGKKCSTLLE